MKYCSTIPSATSARTLCGGVLRLVEFALLDLPRQRVLVSLRLAIPFHEVGVDSIASLLRLVRGLAFLPPLLQLPPP